jgi:hypothetical protein
MGYAAMSYLVYTVIFPYQTENSNEMMLLRTPLSYLPLQFLTAVNFLIFFSGFLILTLLSNICWLAELVSE